MTLVCLLGAFTLDGDHVVKPRKPREGLKTLTAASGGNRKVAVKSVQTPGDLDPH